jgi:hypothetical protein
MNILIEGGDLNPPFSEGTRNIARTHWQELIKRGHNVIILTRRKDSILGKNHKREEVVGGVKYYRWSNYLGLLLALYKIRRKEKVDVIHIFARGLRPTIYLKILKKMLKKPILFSLLGYAFDSFANIMKFKKFLGELDYLAISSKAVFDKLRGISENNKMHYQIYGINLTNNKKVKGIKNIFISRFVNLKLLEVLKKVSSNNNIKIIFNEKNLKPMEKRYIQENFFNFSFLDKTDDMVKNLAKTNLMIDLQIKNGEFIQSASPPLLILEALALGIRVISINPKELFREGVIASSLIFLDENNISKIESVILNEKVLSSKNVDLKSYDIKELIKDYEKIYLNLIKK